MNRIEHNTRGKFSKCGYGYITEKGYRRIWDTNEQRYRLEHDVIWEKHNGKIPDRFQVHHIDENKLNNDISNLQLVDTLTHKRLHSGCKIIDNVWWKTCCKCKAFLSIDNFYQRKDGISSWCKKCCVENAVKNKRKGGICL